MSNSFVITNARGMRLRSHRRRRRRPAMTGTIPTMTRQNPDDDGASPTMTGNICDDDKRMGRPGVLADRMRHTWINRRCGSRALPNGSIGDGLSDPTSLRGTARARAAQHPRRGPRRGRGGAPRERRRPRLRAPALRPHGRHRARPPRRASCGISTRPTTPPRPSGSPWSATGGYGRGTLAPGSDVDLLFLLPYKQTAWGESVVEAMLYVLWDLKLKVGHATRSVDECIREAQGGHDDPHRAARGAVLFGDRALYDDFVARFDQRGRARARRAEFVDAKLERARRPRRQGRRLALPRRAQRQGRQGRASRPQHAVLDRQIRLPGAASRRSSSRPACSRRRSCSCSQRCEDFLWRVRCHMHFVDRPRRGAPDLRPAAPDRRAPRLWPGAAACPASSAS